MFRATNQQRLLLHFKRSTPLFATPPCGAQSLATIAPLSGSEGSIGLTWDADRASNTIPSAELGGLLRNQTAHPADDENRSAKYGPASGRFLGLGLGGSAVQGTLGWSCCHPSDDENRLLHSCHVGVGDLRHSASNTPLRWMLNAAIRIVPKASSASRLLAHCRGHAVARRFRSSLWRGGSRHVRCSTRGELERQRGERGSCRSAEPSCCRSCTDLS
jgi:hypothetical protein